MMLGVPAEPRQQVRLIDESAAPRAGSDRGAPRPALEATGPTWLMYYDLIKQRHAEPRDDTISRLILR